MPTFESSAPIGFRERVGEVLPDVAQFALHLLPSGILTPGCIPIIGNGVVVDLGGFFDEIDGLTARGVDTSKLVVSGSAPVITPYNRTLDKVTERFAGSRRIGTTGRGRSLLGFLRSTNAAWMRFSMSLASKSPTAITAMRSGRY